MSEAFKIEMPKVSHQGADKDNLKSFIPYLVYDTENEEQSTILVHHTKETVIWFDEDGWVGHSSLEHFKESARYQVVRPYEVGEQLIVTMR